jgi:hypothetical protein
MLGSLVSNQVIAGPKPAAVPAGSSRKMVSPDGFEPPAPAFGKRRSSAELRGDGRDGETRTHDESCSQSRRDRRYPTSRCCSSQRGLNTRRRRTKALHCHYAMRAGRAVGVEPTHSQLRRPELVHRAARATNGLGSRIRTCVSPARGERGDQAPLCPDGTSGAS